MSKVAGFIIGGAEVIAGIVLVATGVGGPLGVELIISGSATILAQGVADLSEPKTPARQASEMTIQLGEQPRSMFIGEGFTAGSLVTAFDFGGKYGTDWEVLIIRLADHKCGGLTEFKVGDTFYDYTGNGNVDAFDGEHYPHLHIYFRADTNTENFPSEVTDNWPGWSAYDQGGSGCDIAVLYRCDTPNSSNPLYPGGRPTFGFVLKGLLCYDPRLDDTVGGSGSHRWEDPATREWSENAAVCRYNWVRGVFANDDVDNPGALLVGRGLSALEAPPENIFAAANLCDEEVNGKPRYRVAGPIYANQPFIDVEKMFADATGGSIVTRQGSVELEPGAAKAIVAIFTDDDLVVGSKSSWNGGFLSESSTDWVNSVVANFADPSQQWEGHDAPVVRDEADIIADGEPREANLGLRLVKDVDQAQRVADISRRLGRLWGRAGVTLPPRFCELEDNDWVQYISKINFGGATKTFQIQTYQVDEKFQNTVALREISAECFTGSVYNPDYSNPATPTPPPPAIGTPDETAGSWALAAVMLTDAGASVPALKVTGNSFNDDDQVQDVIIEYWKSDGVIDPVANPDDPAWIMEGTHSPGALEVDITSIEGGATYYAAVTYIVSGVSGDRLVLGPETAGSLDVSGQIPAVDNDGTLASDSTTNPPSVHAVRVYVANAVRGLLELKGGQDCSGNPNYPAASKGDAYVVTVAGKIGGAAGTIVGVNDVFFATADNAGGTQAAVGASWDTMLHSASLAGALISANNLSDVANPATAGANIRPIECLIVACSDETTALAAGTGKVSFRIPYAFTVTEVYASLVTAQASGSIFTVDINEAGVSILSTKLTIDNTETDSDTAAAPAVISDSSIARRALMTVDVDQIGDGTAKGLKIALVGHRT